MSTETNMEAPERIWTCDETKDIFITEAQPDTTEYIRADLHDRLTARVAELEAALETLLHRYELYCGGPDAKLAGHTDRELLSIARAALSGKGE